MERNKMSYNMKKYNKSYNTYNKYYYSQNYYCQDNQYQYDYQYNYYNKNRTYYDYVEEKKQKELLKLEEIEQEKNKIISERKTKINTEIRNLITEKIKSLSNFPKKPVYEKFGEVAKKIRFQLKNKEFTVDMIVNIIGNTLRETRNSLEILNKIMYYAEILKNLHYFGSNSLDQFINRSLSTSNFCLLNQEYLNTILQYKIFNRPNSLEEFNNKIKDHRRPIDLEKNEYYHYLPLDCSDNMNFCSILNSLIKDNLLNIIRFDELLSSVNMESQNGIDSELCLRWNCILSHNIDEIYYHPLNFKTSLCFNQRLCDKKQTCHLAHSEEELILLFNKEQFNSIINDINHLTDPKNNVQGILYEHFLNKSVNDSVSDEILFIKTNHCKKKLICKDFKTCYDYHNLLEKRRDPRKYINLDNTICEYIFVNKRWEDPSKCPKGDKCDKFHTKNELMYDSRNYRRLFECEIEKSEKFCPYLKYCYYKHAEDFQVPHMYLSEHDKILLNKMLDSLQKKRENYERIKEISKQFYSCLYCLETIRNIEVFLQCKHYFCQRCFDKLVTENNSVCIKCKFKFKENEKNLYFIGKLCTNEEIKKIQIEKNIENISDIVNVNHNEELVEKEYLDNFDGFNEDLQNLFKKSNK